MAAKKDPEPNDGQKANADQIAKVSDLTDPDVVVKADEVKTHKVKSPSGAVSEVPESILDALLDSGYKKA